MGKRQSTKKKAAKPSTQLQKDSAETLKRIRAEAKAAEKKLGSASSKQKKQAPTVVQRPAPRPKLTIRLPKVTTQPGNALAASDDETASPANVPPVDVIRGDTLPPSSPPAGSDMITPPPKIPGKGLDDKVRDYLSKRGLLDDETVDIDLAGSESEDNSETEELLRMKGGVFSEGIETEGGNGSELDGDGDDIGEDEYQTDADEYEEEEAPLSLRFSVPVDGADKSIDVISTASFAALRTTLANTMDVSPKSVYVATRFSTQPRNASFTHLTDDESLRALFAAARRHIEENQNKKKKTQKEFYVEVKDLGAAKKAKEEKGKGKEKKEKEKKKRKHDDSDEEEAVDAGTDTEVVEKKRKKMSAAQWAVVIEQDNHCVEHGGHGCIRRKDKYGNEIHEQMEKKDIGSWSILKAAGYPSTTVPPPQLKIAQKSTAPLPPPPTPAPAPASTPMPMVFTSPYGFHPGMMPGPMLQNPYMYQPPMPQNYNRHYRDFPSSDPVEEDDPTIFPYISDWLAELDAGLRGDGHGFAQYADEFSSRQLKRLDDLLTIKEADLLAYGIPKGTAQKMQQYAEKDVKAIQKQERKKRRLA
ncbi:hypothetical protein C8F01DRAFT_1229691 [Mycena amicta]|nr:hypothetical protein C8F01DRAFT_1229691 [Mycena amicta]